MTAVIPRKVVISLVGVVAYQDQAASRGSDEASCAAHDRVSSGDELREFSGRTVHVETEFGQTSKDAQPAERKTRFIDNVGADHFRGTEDSALRKCVVD